MTATLTIDVVIDSDLWKKQPDAEATIRRAMTEAARACATAPGDVAVVLTGDDAIQALNKRWRGQDKPTNVLSFAALDGARPKPGMPWLLGDVVLTSGVIAREAKAQRKSVQHHLSHLAVHGVLHLLGYDHEQDRDAEAMEALEIAALAGMGIANPYELGR